MRYAFKYKEIKIDGFSFVDIDIKLIPYIPDILNLDIKLTYKTH